MCNNFGILIVNWQILTAIVTILTDWLQSKIDVTYGNHFSKPVKRLHYQLFTFIISTLSHKIAHFVTSALVLENLRRLKKQNKNPALELHS